METITLKKNNHTHAENLVNSEKGIAETVLQVLESARKITCSYNYVERPWQVILATSEESQFPKLFSCLDVFNQKCHSKAEVLGVILEKKYYDVYGEEINNKFYNSEVFMTAVKLEAEKFNCSFNQMFGFSREMIKEQFDMVFNFEPKVMFTIDYQHLNTKTGSPNHLMREKVELNAM